MGEIVGKRFGCWEVLGEEVKKVGGATRYFYACRCICGAETLVDSYTLRSGKSTSCGCNANVRHGGASKDSLTAKEYSIWEGFNARCYNPNRKNYKNYGGRGITVCDEWRGKDGFVQFLVDMGMCPDGKSLGRKDNDGPYSKTNCSWETIKEQGRNKRSNRRLTFKGETHILSDWALLLGIPKTTLQKRIKSGFPIEQVLSKEDLSGKTKDIKNTVLTYKGEIHTIGEWADVLGVTYQLLKNRYERGDAVADILNPDHKKTGPKVGTKYNVKQGSRLKDISGTTYGRLTVLSTFRKPCGNQNVTYARCKCDCGNEAEVLLNNLKKGVTKSCGCYRKEVIGSLNKK